MGNNNLKLNMVLLRLCRNLSELYREWDNPKKRKRLIKVIVFDVFAMLLELYANVMFALELHKLAFFPNCNRPDPDFFEGRSYNCLHCKAQDRLLCSFRHLDHYYCCLSLK